MSVSPYIEKEVERLKKEGRWPNVDTTGMWRKRMKERLAKLEDKPCE